MGRLNFDQLKPGERVALDTVAIIYLLESHPGHAPPLRKLFHSIEDAGRPRSPGSSSRPVSAAPGAGRPPAASRALHDSGKRPDAAYFWATHTGTEIDLVLFVGRRRIGVECKRVDAPRLTPSMRIALTDLKLDEIFVVYPGRSRYPLADRVTVVPLAEFVGVKER